MADDIANRIIVSLGPKLVRVRVLGLAAIAPIIGALAASVGGTSSAVASLNVGRSLSATVRADVTASGALQSPRALAAAVSCATSASGDLRVVRGLNAVLAAAGVATGTLSVGGGFDARVSAPSATVGDITVGRPLTSLITATSVISGTLSTSLTLSGQAFSTSVAQGDVTVTRSLAAGIPSAGVATGTLTVAKGFDAAIASPSSTSGDLTVARQLAASASAVSLAVGDLTTAKALASLVQANSTAISMLSTVAQARTATAMERQLPTVASAPLAAYGLSRMIAGYAGPLIRVQRGADAAAQTDLGSDENGAVDMAAASTFANGSELRVVTLYDQTGNGRHAVSAASGSAIMPILTTMRAAYGSAFAATPIILHQGLGYPYPSNVHAGLALPAGLTADQANVSVFDVAASNAGRRSQVWGGLGSGGASFTFGVGGGGFSNFAFAADGTTSAELYANGASAPRVNLQVVNVNSRSAGRSLWVEDVSTTSGAALPSKTLTGGHMGGGADTASDRYLTGHRSAFVVYPALSEADAATVRATLSTSYGTAKRPIRLVQSGSSVPEGRGPDNRTPGFYSPQSAIMLALGGLNREIDVWNIALSGRNSGDVSGAMNSEVSPLVKSGALNIFLIDVGGNSLLGGSTGAQVYSLNKGSAAAAKSAGFNQIIAATLSPRSDLTGSKDTERQNYNSMLLNGSTDFGWSACADYASIAEFITPAPGPSNTYYQVDQDGSYNHYVNKGQPLRSAKLIPGLQGIVNGTITGPSLPAAPGQVTGLTAGTATSSTQPLSWTAPASGGTPSAYTVEYRKSTDTAWTVASTSVTGTSGSVTGLTASTSYDYRVTATNAGGSGTPSAIVSNSTAASTPQAARVVKLNLFGNSNPPATDATSLAARSDWNDMSHDTYKGGVTLPLKDTTGVSAGWTATWVTPPLFANQLGVNPISGYPVEVTKTAGYIDANNGQTSAVLRIAGFAPGASIKIDTLSSRTATGANRATVVSTTGGSTTVNADGNSTIVTIPATLADANGNIDITYKQGSGAILSPLNLVVLTSNA